MNWYKGLLTIAVLLGAVPGSFAQTRNDGLSGADAHEDVPAERKYLLGDWKGHRKQLLERGVDLDVQYLSDQLWNIRSDKKARLASWNRFRGTVNLDLGKLAGAHDLYFHITGLWQAGANIGTYLGTIANPSGIASVNTFRLDSYWIEKRFLRERLVARVGQFAGQDFYGTQHDAASFVTEPLDYAFNNLGVNYESYSPRASTPAAEVRVIPRAHFYVKSMVFAADRVPYAHNPTGLVPQFRGAASSASEIGWTPGQPATEVKAFDTVQSRRGYSGLYQLGGTYNPGKFASADSTSPVSGNYVIYGLTNQALWRTAPNSGTGLDVTFGIDWSPGNRSRHNQQTTAGLRYNELLPIHRHNTVSFGYIRSGVNYRGAGPSVLLSQRRNAEHVLELNALIKPTGWLLLQPVIQRYVQLGGSAGNATVFGFRSKVDF